jgi:hypothetical protein
MTKRGSRSFEGLALLAIVAVAVPAIVLGATALRPKKVAPQTQSSAGTAAVISASPAAANAKAQICAACWGDGSPQPIETGRPVVQNGVQVVSVGLVGGWYLPDRFTVKAGMPVTVVFTGRAEGCLAEPEFPELGVKASLASGTATVALGRLKAGTYTFTCSIGVNEGRITVE